MTAELDPEVARGHPYAVGRPAGRPTAHLSPHALLEPELLELDPFAPSCGQLSLEELPLEFEVPLPLD